ncbi:MAG: hypothetical protein PHU03_03435 [Syntrophales bacterium]|nr:hypothetical protein [Syntrophales bacterium]
MAETQTFGRGRLDRSWDSPLGGRETPEGTAEEVNDDGALIVLNSDGTKHRIITGGVFIVEAVDGKQ